MLLLLVSWILLFFIFLSFGEFFVRLFDKSTKTNSGIRYNFMEKFWIGIFGIVILSMLFNFFIPLDIFVFCFYLIIAIILNIYYKLPVVIYRDIRLFYSKNRILVFCFFLIAFVVMCFSLYPDYQYDSGLYHTQTMMWYKQYAIIPGLGNVHGRLAFNSMTLIIYELFNYQLGLFETFTSISGLCLLVFSAWCLSKISKLSFVSSLYLYFLQVLLLLSFSSSMASYNTDLLPALLVISLIISFIFNENRWNKPLFFMCLPLLCVTFKLSTYPICLVSFLFCVYYIKQKKYRQLLISVLCGSFLIIPWLARFVIETGYLVYPFPSIDIFSFDWKMPLSKVIEEKDSVVGFSRMPGFNESAVAALPLKEWIFIWYFRLSPFNSLFLLLALFSPIFIPFIYKNKTFDKIVLLCWAIAFVGLLLSFATAPATRFHYAFVILASTLPFLLFKDSRQFNKNGYFPKFYFSSFFFIIITFLWVVQFCLTSILADSIVPLHMVAFLDMGFLETRVGKELFLARYYYKSIALIVILLLFICLLILYRNNKVKSCFVKLINFLVLNKYKTMMLPILFVIGFSMLNLRYDYSISENTSVVNLLISPQDPQIDKPKMEEYLVGPNQVAFYPINSDRCFDCDLPCSNIKISNLKMRGASIKDGFRIGITHE